MKLTFPHFGDTHLILDLFLRDLGIEVVTPSPNSMDTLQEGCRFAPEEMCLPFKLMIGNLMEAHRMGADTVIMPASQGPCRLGEYAELLRSILEKEGILFQWILLDAPGSIGIEEFRKRLLAVIETRKVGNGTVLKKLFQLYLLLIKMERLEKRIRHSGGFVKDSKVLRQILTDCRGQLRKATGLREGRIIVKMQTRVYRRIPMEKKHQPLRIVLTGELFSMIEPFANHQIEDLLLDLGVSFQKRVTLGWWLRQNGNHYRKHLKFWGITKMGNPYLPHAIGGFAKETVEEGWISKKKGFDGVLQVFPAGCMPEIVAKSVLTQMAREQNLKLMTLIFDEMSGDAGNITRVEAFIDMLDRSKDLKNKAAKSNRIIQFNKKGTI